MLPCSSPQPPPRCTRTHTHTPNNLSHLRALFTDTRGSGGLSRARPQAPSLSGPSQTAVLARSTRARFCLSSWPGGPGEHSRFHTRRRQACDSAELTVDSWLCRGQAGLGKSSSSSAPQFPRLEDVTSPLPQSSVIVRVRGSESQGRRRGALWPVGPCSAAPLPRSIPVSRK